MLRSTRQHLENARGCLEMIRVKSLLVNRSISVREELEGTVTMVMATIDRRSLSLTSVKRFESLALPQATSTDILMAKPRQVLTDHTNITRDDIKQEAGSIFNPPRTQQPEQISNPPSYAKVFKLPSNEPHKTSVTRRPVTRSSKIADFKQDPDASFELQVGEEQSSSIYRSTFEQDEPSHSTDSRHGSSRRIRGPYRKYDEQIKRTAITLAKQTNYDIGVVSKKMQIPAKNIKRWIASGAVRKKGGRKTQDPKMESNLNNWIQGYIATYKKMPSSKEIKQKAMDYSSKAMPFKASKGWLEKFLARHGYSKNRPAPREPIASARIDTADIFVKSEEPYEYSDKYNIHEFGMEDYQTF